MTRHQQIDAILQILTQEGLSIEQIEDHLNFPIERRTLQRRLKELKENHLLLTKGDARSIRYFSIEKADKKSASVDLIPLSLEGKQILYLVSRPENQRIPVGYNREFLDNYRPNIDSYLSAEEKDKLAIIGTTQGDDQPAGTYARQILNRLMIDLSWNSSRLEGNTYSLLDTELLIHDGKPADDKSAKETQMILNHKDAIEFLVDMSDEIGFNRYTILNLHALLSNNLLPDPSASGRLRTFGVGITNSVFTPLGIPQLISEYFDLILDKANQIENTFEQAFFVLVHFPYLQPFDDVNKRVSRLAANIPFNQKNLSPLSFIDVPEDYYIKGMLGIYELNRIDLLKDVFIWAYERSSLRYSAIRQSLGEPDTFRLKYREEMRDTIVKVVSQALQKDQAILIIKTDAENIPQDDQLKFIETVETELMGLHEGNFARYRIRPSEFKKWKDNWEINALRK
ncbi:Fic family protein [Chryseobacterium sp. ISL-6]|uniref:Fic family protein n=1 Tax=Chryseobacterium sp. ISL-6 TaxID=2819143 RepID=UPI001BE9AA76|nr:Fic family protein [Chryseobacterium sp. ISL-6]MBT2620630.1 Fic family protein [Chryseobacterium sp. ISL-6]